MSSLVSGPSCLSLSRYATLMWLDDAVSLTGSEWKENKKTLDRMTDIEEQRRKIDPCLPSTSSSSLIYGVFLALSCSFKTYTNYISRIR